MPLKSIALTRLGHIRRCKPPKILALLIGAFFWFAPSAFCGIKECLISNIAQQINLPTATLPHHRQATSPDEEKLRKKLSLKDQLNRQIDQRLGLFDPNYNREQLRADLDALKIQGWKRKVFFSLWRLEADQGRRFFDTTSILPKSAERESFFSLKRPGDTRTFVSKVVDSVWGFQLTNDVANAVLAVARSKGLKPADRYLVVPGRMILTGAIRNLEATVFMIVATTYAGQILDRMDIGIQDPLINQTDTGALKQNEVIVIIKMNAKDGNGEGGANAALGMYDDQIIQELKKEDRKHQIIVVDLSKDRAGSDGNPVPIEQVPSYIKSSLTEALHGKSSIKIKKVIFAGHGHPGGLSADSGDLEIKDLDKFVDGIKPFLTHDEPEIHFDACYVAQSAAAQQSLKDFAEHALPKGARIFASRFEVTHVPSKLESLVRSGPDFSESSPVIKSLTFVNPAFTLLGVGGFHGLAQFSRWKDAKKDEVDQDLGLGLDHVPPFFDAFTGGRFVYQVGKGEQQDPAPAAGWFHQDAGETTDGPGSD